MSAWPLLFVDHAPALGGAERSLLLLLQHLDRTRWRPHLACVEGALADEARRLGVDVHPMVMPRLRSSPRAPVHGLKLAFQLRGLARAINAIACVANTVRAAFYTAPAARWAGLPFIWYMRDFWLSETRPRYLWADTLGKRWLCAAARCVIVNSHATARHLPCSPKVKVVYNGIEVARFDPSLDGRPFRQQYHIPPKALVVGTVGRLRPWKGQDRFLRAMHRVAAVRSDVWFVVVGGTPLQRESTYPRQLHRLAAQLGLSARTVFTGHLDDVRPALAAMDVFVHPGDPEPFGLVVVEAMAMGTPVVGFAHGALPEIVLPDQTGLLVPPGNEEALAHAVLTLLARPEWRLAMGRAARERVVRYFTVQRTVRQVEAIFTSVFRL